MYIIEDTVLIPGMQYILSQIKDNKKNALAKIRSYVEQSSKESQDQLRRVVEAIEQYYDNNPEAETILREYARGDYVCDLCAGDCQGCLSAFCGEILKYLYSSTNQGEIVSESEAEKNDEKHFRFERFPENIEIDLIAKDSASKQYFNQHKRNTRGRKVNDRLIVLKGLSSSTPAILNAAFSAQKYHGGGFYLNWNGFGIVIDPGYHFLYNMHKKGLTVLDVQAVIVTHEHIDHTNDIRLLDDLYYDQRSNYKKEISIHPGQEKPPITWYLDKVTMEMVNVFKEHESGFTRKEYDFQTISPNDSMHVLFKDDSTAIYMHVFPTEHEQLKSKKGEYQEHTFGLKFEFISDGLVRTVFYSSDTRYNEKIGDAAEGADIVIANISSVYDTDLLLLLQKDRHLGFKGCYELLRRMKDKPPKLFLISEFWNGKTDVRFDLARYLFKKIQEYDASSYNNTKIIPGEIGMEINLKNCELRCDYCGEFSDDTILVRPETNNGQIHAVCRNCYY